MEKVKLKPTGTLTPAETPTNQISHEIIVDSITKGDLHGNSKFGGKSRGLQ